MSQYTPASLESLLSSLKLTGGVNHVEVLKHANNVLKSNKSHARALHTRAVALLNLDRFDDAFNVLSNPALAGKANLERAYCLYKLGRLEEALASARGSGGDRDERGLKHVEAQAAYRLERFAQAAEIYDGLSKSGCQAENEDYDTTVNISATNAQLAWSGGSIGDGKVDRSAMDAFETSFNAACGAVARGALGQALVLLRRARELGNQLEDLDDDERRMEVAPVLAQEIYVLAKLGRWEEALTKSRELDVKSITDASLKVIATNNEIAIASRLPNYNPHLSLLATTDSTTTSSFSQPFLFQSRTLGRNHAVIQLEAGKYQAAKKLATAHLRLCAGDEEARVVLAAARQNSVEKLAERDPNDIGLALTLAQTRMRRGNITGAIQTLEKLRSVREDSRHLPGVVGLLVGLYQAQGRRQHVKDVLSEASEWWKKAPAPSQSLLRASGKAHLDGSPTTTDLAAAHEIFKSLLSHTPNDPFCNAGLIASSPNPTATATTLTTSLTPVETLLSKIDVASLESLGVARPSPSAATTAKRSSATHPTKAPKPAKKKKTHNFDTSKTPDPERWLPLRDRSSYRPKGRKDKKRAAGATQGGSGGGGGEESMELAGGGKIDVIRVASAAAAGGSGGGGGGKGKKKKKSKW